MSTPSTTAAPAPRKVVTLSQPVSMIDLDRALQAFLIDQGSEPLWLPYFTIAGDNSPESSWLGGPSYIDYFVVSSCTKGASLLITPHEMRSFDLDGEYRAFEIRSGGQTASCRCLQHQQRQVDAQTALQRMEDGLRAKLSA